jgi:hypothetical protein
MRAATALILTAVVAGVPATAVPASAAQTTRCTSIVVPRVDGPVKAGAVMAVGTSCRTAHAVARGYIERGLDPPVKARGYDCDLVSDRQIGCSRGRAEVIFDVIPVDEDARPATCADATLFRKGGRRYRATTIQRSEKVSCALARKLLRGAYGKGSLPRGWRCRTGRAGAACRRGALKVTADAP